MRHLLSINDLKREEFFKILARGHEHRKNRALSENALRGKGIALMFEKSSTRTRLSFAVAVQELGGSSQTIESHQLQLGRGETIEDTTEVFSRYFHAIMIRAKSHANVARMVGMNKIPVINGLTDREHPCQILADYMTMDQYGFDIRNGNTVIAFIGDPNNVFNSLARAALFTGSEIRIALPEGYETDDDVKAFLKESGVRFHQFRDPAEAVSGANVIYTDVWVSMGHEAEEEDRKAIFAPYCVSEELLKHAAERHIVMHCLPAHRGQEITSGVMDKYGEQIFNQAENRMHVQKALLEWIFKLI
jgi:ornithine carbamoyltransferase